ncbi:hypothetical protein ABBQ32_004829 [Trebouxia sp. C0010 RCD-2024]
MQQPCPLGKAVFVKAEGSVFKEASAWGCHCGAAGQATWHFSLLWGHCLVGESMLSGQILSLTPPYPPTRTYIPSSTLPSPCILDPHLPDPHHPHPPVTYLNLATYPSLPLSHPHSPSPTYPNIMTLTNLSLIPSMRPCLP